MSDNKNTGPIKKIIVISLLFMLSSGVTAQEQATVIDQIVAVVGKNMILESEVEAQYFQLRMQGSITGTATETKCMILENMLQENLFLNQAELDSIQVSESEVEQEMDRRLRYFIAQFGSQEKLEEYYQKSIIEIKDEFRDLLRKQLKARDVKAEITKNVYVTPSEVKEYYRSLPKDSIPLINAQVEIAQIVKIPPVSMEQKVIVKEKLRDLRRRILNGENFSTLAILYSEDPGSASKGGELGFYGRGELFPEFEAVAFNLKEGEISDIVETKAGFHIIQMIEKKGDFVNVRHILLQVKPSPDAILHAQEELDSVAELIRSDSISWDDAVKKFSDDPNKTSGGLLINPYQGTTRWEMDELEPQVSFTIDKLEVGEISRPVPFTTDDGENAYRLLKVKIRTEPHRANLEDDYTYLQQHALAYKQNKKIQDWIDKNMQNAYIMIIDDYKSCDFMHRWTQ